MTFIPPLNQIAFSVVDLRLTERWFREGFGLLPAGGSRWKMRGLMAARVQGLPRAASTCWWLVGRNPWFQLELFQFERPIAELMPRDSRPCDIGYTRIGLWVADFDATLARLKTLGSLPLSAPLGAPGKRRACVRNPDGVFVEIMEDDPLATVAAPGRSNCPAAIRSVTMSVPDLTKTALFLSTGVGIKESDVTLHTPEHEALWGLAGARTLSKVFLAGDVLVEAVQYLDPVGRPRRQGYRINDQGILNIAFGARTKKDHVTVYRRSRDAGARPNCSPLYMPGFGAGVVYVNDPQNFSVEILWLNPGRPDRDWGFDPLPIQQRPEPDTLSVSQRVTLHAPVERVWAVVTDHEGMAQWIGFKPVTRTVDGTPDVNGYGSVRLMHGPAGKVVEQVIDCNPLQSLRYRVIKGSPLVCHQGEVRLTPVGSNTELTWTIRFRPKIAGTGFLLRPFMQRMLGAMVDKHLKSYVERR